MSPAVVLNMVGTPTRHELVEYPGEVDELDDVVLSHLITDGRLYQLWVGDSELSQEILDDHIRRAALMTVSVVVERPARGACPKVVIKRVDIQPIQKYELAEFPEDLDELDDFVLNNRVAEGGSVQMSVNGQLLTPEKYDDYKRAGRKLVIHVRTARQQAAGPYVPSAPPWETISVSRDGQEEMGALQSLREQLSKVRDSTYDDRGQNVLLVSMDAEAGIIDKIKQDTIDVEGRDPELGREAQELLTEMTRVFRAGLGETLSTRKTIGHLRKNFQELGEAFLKGNTAAVKQLVPRCKDFAEKLEIRSRNVTTMLENLQDKLGEKVKKYDAAERKHRSRRNYSLTGAVTSGSGFVACGVGTASAGLTATTTTVGWFSTAVATAWHPPGLIFLAGCGICAVIACISSARAANFHAATSNMNTMSTVARKAEQVGALNEELWNGVCDNLGIAYSAVEDLGKYTPDQLTSFAEAMEEVATALRNIEDAVDEYLVYLSLKKIYPINFRVETLVGEKRCAEIKDMLSIR